MVAVVAYGALTGIARVQQNSVWSNALGFTVPSGSNLTLGPNLINMAVGDTQAIQALGSNGQPVTGLTWASSDPTVVSLSTDDPPILSALGPGHVTITGALRRPMSLLMPLRCWRAELRFQAGGWMILRMRTPHSRQSKS